MLNGYIIIIWVSLGLCFLSIGGRGRTRICMNFLLGWVNIQRSLLITKNEQVNAFICMRRIWDHWHFPLDMYLIWVYPSPERYFSSSWIPLNVHCPWLDPCRTETADNTVSLHPKVTFNRPLGKSRSLEPVSLEVPTGYRQTWKILFVYSVPAGGCSSGVVPF